MNKTELNLNISTLNVNNFNVISIRMTIGWDVFLLCKKLKMNNGELNLNISTLNVNSFNVSTMGGKVSKTFVKLKV